MSTAKLKKKHLNQYTRKELLNLPVRYWDTESTYDSIILFPATYLHDSGYSCMCIIGVIDSIPVEIISQGCDDIEWLLPEAEYIASVYAIGQMRMDCLAKSKAFHPRSRGSKFKVGCSLSSITIKVIRS